MTTAKTIGKPTSSSRPRPPWRRGGRAGVRAGRLAALLGCAGAPNLALTNAALALDLDGTNGLITETIASRDRLRTYDDSKKYGVLTVAEQNRTQFLPDGLRIGNFRYFPEGSAVTGYDSNIFGAPDHATGDMRSEAATELRVQSDLPRHVVDMSLGGRIVTFLENGSQDYADAHISATGGLHFDSAHTLSANVLSELNHEERADGTSSRFAATPVPIWHNHGSIGLTRDVGQIHGTISATVDDYNYFNVASLQGGLLDENTRDITLYNVEARAGWRIMPGMELVTKVRGLRQINAGDGKISHTGNGLDALAGLSFESSPLLRWRLLGGYGLREFDQVGVASIGTSIMEGDATWLPTQRLTITASGKREIQDQLTSANASNISTQIKGRAEYEIWHNVVGHVEAKGELDQFQGLNRTDTVYAGTIGLDYYATKNWFFTLSYEHEMRQSTIAEYDETRDKISIGAKWRY